MLFCLHPSSWSIWVRSLYLTPIYPAIRAPSLSYLFHQGISWISPAQRSIISPTSKQKGVPLCLRCAWFQHIVHICISFLFLVHRYCLKRHLHWMPGIPSSQDTMTGVCYARSGYSHSLLAGTIALVSNTHVWNITHFEVALMGDMIMPNIHDNWQFANSTSIVVLSHGDRLSQEYLGDAVKRYIGKRKRGKHRTLFPNAAHHFDVRCNLIEMRAFIITFYVTIGHGNVMQSYVHTSLIWLVCFLRRKSTSFWPLHKNCNEIIIIWVLEQN